MRRIDWIIVTIGMALGTLGLLVVIYYLAQLAAP